MGREGGPGVWGTHGNAGQVDGHEEEVNVGTDGLDADGPDLGHNYGPYGAGRGGKVETAGAEGGWEDLVGEVDIFG
jgi:hypothetical protein